MPQPREAVTSRPRLSADLVIEGAVALADEIGVDAMTIRKLADALDTRPMTIYHHVPNKEAIIDGMVDLVFGEIDTPPVDLDWQQAMRLRCRSVRAVLARHPWATPLMESRTNPGPNLLEHHDAVLGCLRGGGLSVEMTAHAYAVLDSYVYGFALQEASLPATEGAELADLAEGIIEPFPADQYPHLVELVELHATQPGYSFGAEFEFGLDLILGALAARA